MNKLSVFHNDIPVGTLGLSPDNLMAFEYNNDFLQSGFSISPFYLPLKPGVFVAKRDPFNGMFGVFNDSLPDGWGILLMQRALRKKGVNPASLNALQQLSLIASNGMGALRYEPSEADTLKNGFLDLDEIAGEVGRILKDAAPKDLDRLVQLGGSSGGARPKIYAHIENKEWLIKFPSSMDVENIGALEYLYAKTAKDCGIQMPETRFFNNAYFGVERFDRIANRRIHMHSASGLLYAGHRLPSLDYIDLIKLTFALTRNIADSYKMYRQMIFNVLTHNRDDHAKNFSFLYDGEWKLSPAYDLVFSHGFNGQHTTTIAGTGLPEHEDLLTVAKETGLDKKKCSSIIEELKEGTKELVHEIKPLI